MKCSRCQHENEAGAKFCEECAAPLARACAKCGRQLSPTAKFCPECAHPTGLSAAPPPAHAIRLPGVLHPQAPRREDPDLQERAGGRAQAGHGALRRPEGLDGAARRPRSRGGPQAPRPRPRADDGGRPPLRGHRQPGDGRRHHGALRRAARPRGSRRARLLRRAADAGVRQAVRRGGAPDRGRAAADPGRPELGRGGRPLHRQRPPHGLHGRRPDDPPGRAHGADGHAGVDPHLRPRR